MVVISVTTFLKNEIPIEDISAARGKEHKLSGPQLRDYNQFKSLLQGGSSISGLTEKQIDTLATLMVLEKDNELPSQQK